MGKTLIIAEQFHCPLLQRATLAAVAKIQVDLRVRPLYSRVPLFERKPMSTITASHILVEREYEAEDILKKLYEGNSFESLAKAYSKCPSGEEGGDLGSFGKGQMVASFEQAAFALKPGEVSKPVQTQFGYHIIKRT